jgi:uncharacterized protein YeaO (DUF488 family)
MIALKRVYDPPGDADGRRILVDRLWPRGLSNEAARIDEWRRDLAPSDALRRWFGHDRRKWAEFERRYRLELGEKREALRALAELARRQTVTLVYAARDPEHNNAVVLEGLLEELQHRDS